MDTASRLTSRLSRARSAGDGKMVAIDGSWLLRRRRANLDASGLPSAAQQCPLSRPGRDDSSPGQSPRGTPPRLSQCHYGGFCRTKCRWREAGVGLQLLVLRGNSSSRPDSRFQIGKSAVAAWHCELVDIEALRPLFLCGEGVMVTITGYILC